MILLDIEQINESPLKYEMSSGGSRDILFNSIYIYNMSNKNQNEILNNNKNEYLYIYSREIRSNSQIYIQFKCIQDGVYNILITLNSTMRV